MTDQLRSFVIIDQGLEVFASHGDQRFFHPFAAAGAGVGNTRNEISIKTLGIPVIAIGIPTVVETAVLVNDSLDLFIKKLQDEAKSNEYLNNLKQEDNYEEIREVLVPNDYNLIVTPKEIDDLIENMKDIVAKGINQSL